MSPLPLREILRDLLAIRVENSSINANTSKGCPRLVPAKVESKSGKLSAVIEVFTEPALAHLLGQIAVGGGDHAHIHFVGFGACPNR